MNPNKTNTEHHQNAPYTLGSITVLLASLSIASQNYLSHPTAHLYSAVICALIAFTACVQYYRLKTILSPGLKFTHLFTLGLGIIGTSIYLYQYFIAL